MDAITHDETPHSQWSFVCRRGSYVDCGLSQHVYTGELKATYAAATQPQGFQAINIKPLRLLKGVMQAPHAADDGNREHLWNNHSGG